MRASFRPQPLKGCLAVADEGRDAPTLRSLPWVHPKREAKPDAKRPKQPNKDMDKLVRMCWKQGWWCERAGNKHVKCWPPGDAAMVPIPSTPSGSRTYTNKLSALKRSGLRT